MIWGLDVGPTSRENGTCVLLLLPVFRPLWPENLSFTFGSDTDLENACASSTAEAALLYRVLAAPGADFSCCSTGLRHVSGEGCLSGACGCLSVSFPFLRVSPRQFLLCAWALSPSALCSFLSGFLPVFWSRWASSVFSPYRVWVEWSGSFSTLEILFSTLHRTRFIGNWQALNQTWITIEPNRLVQTDKTSPYLFECSTTLIETSSIPRSFNTCGKIGNISRWKQEAKHREKERK